MSADDVFGWAWDAMHPIYRRAILAESGLGIREESTMWRQLDLPFRVTLKVAMRRHIEGWAHTEPGSKKTA